MNTYSRSVWILMLILGGLTSSPGTVFAQEVFDPSVSGEEIRLGLRKTIEVGLANNFDLLLSRERIEEARGLAFTRLGALLPNISGESRYTKQRVFQGQFGGRNAVSDPRNIHDLRGRLTQSIFNLSRIQLWRAGKTGVDAAVLDTEVIRRDTIATLALLYYEAVRGEAIVRARESNVTLNKELWDMAVGRKAAGAATGLDVIRAKVQYQTERQRLLQAVIDRNSARLNLIRAMGIPNDTRITFTDVLALKEIPTQTPQEAIAFALSNRAELDALDRRRQETNLQLAAIKGERIPSINFQGDYGLIGDAFDERFGSYTVGGFLTIPLFDGGQREGRIREGRSRLRQQEIRTRNLIHQVSVEVRDALLMVETAREQVLVTQESLTLAQQELTLSRKAFSIGTISHLEIINAQNALANIKDQAIDALFNFNAARVNVARSQGRMTWLYQDKSMMTVRRIP